MTVFRFMSFKELELFQKGEILENHTDHHLEGMKTSSKGFCFIDEDDFILKSAYEFLGGIVSNEMCARFEVDEKLLIKSYGVYADPDSVSWFDTITIDEYCCESYSNKNFKLLEYIPVQSLLNS